MRTKPATDSATDPATDLMQRWLPTAEQIAAGLAVLATVPDDERSHYIAVVVLVQPGKTYGIWQTGQEVIALPGVWLSENVRGESLYPLRDADDAAEQVGLAWLRKHGLWGTVATAKVFPDGNAAVFESIFAIIEADQASGEAR